VLVDLPAPLPIEHVSGAVVWAGAVEVLGTQLIVRGRSFDLGNLHEAEHHAAAVLAACRVLREACA
jgi:hypothetical protein